MRCVLTKRVALLTLPILFLFFVSVSYAKKPHNTVVATVRVIQAPKIKIRIIQPENKTYYTDGNSESILLMFLIQQEGWWSSKTKYWAGYSLDGSPNVTVSTSTFWFFEPRIYMKLIKNIPLGTHKLTVYANDTLGDSGSSTVFFTIKKTPCKNFMWLGKCPTTTTTTTTTTIKKTSTTTTTTIKKTTTTTISECSGKSYSKCVSLSNCKWVSVLWMGYCTSK